jgi:uncharacterized protein (DUF2267 family)
LLAQKGENASAEMITRAVFRLLERKMTDGEMGDIHHLLPPTVYDLWPPRLRAA